MEGATMRKTRREAAESQQEAAVVMVETAAPPPADPADEIPSLATEVAEEARFEVVMLADVEDRLRERIREADGTSTGYARAAGTSFRQGKREVFAHRIRACSWYLCRHGWGPDRRAGSGDDPRRA